MMDVAGLQRRLGVRVDGDLGPITLAALFVRCGARPDTAAALASTGEMALDGALILATPLRLAHFLAQVGHESAGFRQFVEIWGPTPAQRRYEGRTDLGNVKPGDGFRFRGRGPIQITGRTNYRRFGTIIGVDLIADPDAAARPPIGIKLACAFWTAHRINAAADRDDVEAVTRIINGGTNGLADRAARLAVAKALLA
ncbi:glycoside hydrolase family 19 protein [Sphingomonas beigongshangi]|uniref:glycoside hydrolase family 19 protein n=1 Tax=Sphingomonas beigongshangi TaxID=2782540 RepID=UPI001EED016B|nr:glycoside hydrolase family 19 protein [Sphingomonas beigongshangi]